METAGIWPARKSGTATRRPEFSSVHETRAQPRQGFGAVAQLVFHLLAQLGERFLITVGNKQRIVAKSAPSVSPTERSSANGVVWRCWRGPARCRRRARTDCFHRP